MACEVMQPPANSGSSAFSPLTLFECTITNAQMLIDSMGDRELLQALKIAGGLHTHIVGVMEPRYDRVCTRSDEHSACLMAGVSAVAPSSAVQPPISATNGGAAFSSAAASAVPATQAKPWGEASVKDEELLMEDDSVDDCLILEEDASFSSGLAAASAGVSAGASARKRLRQEAPAAAGAVVAAPSHGLSSDQANECRTALRNSYKELKGNGPHLFNFSLPITDPVNHRVAEQAIAHAQRQIAHISLPQDVWWSELYAFADDLGAVTMRMREKFAAEKRRQRNRQRKLARRQKSFELLATSLSTDQFDKYRVLLSRDYTSSDEETDEDGGTLRVRALTWESEDMKQMKRQLDETYLEHCANQKQAQQLRRTIREPGCVSGRTPPADCPNWALGDEFRA